MKRWLSLMALLYVGFTELFFIPFKQIMRLLRQVRNGNLYERLPPFQKRIMPISEEMEMMREQLNAMLDSIGDLIKNIASANAERTDMEMRLLQSQLNPHMIFNTLTSIRWMILLQQENWPGSENINNMLIEFSAMLQPIFSVWQSEWTLREELEYVGHYMALQRIRYCADFIVDLPTSDSIYDSLIPHFVLQPVLENSCEHGIVDKLNISVRISTRCDSEFIYITVTDDGCGFTAERLAYLNSRLAGDYVDDSPAQNRRSIGLLNVHKLLRTLYGRECGLTVDSTEGTGTCVTLKVIRRTSP